jgi:hypothetical protein
MPFTCSLKTGHKNIQHAVSLEPNWHRATSPASCPRVQRRLSQYAWVVLAARQACELDADTFEEVVSQEVV